MIPRPSDAALSERKKGDSRPTAISFSKANLVKGRAERINNIKARIKW